MELYVKTLLNGSYTESQCSLFGDEQIELTKSWNEQQVIAKYGSYSKSFSIPIDSNNAEIFKYYNIIGGVMFNSANTSANNYLDPKYFIDARLIINSYEIVGYISVQGFSTKEHKPYSYNVVFYGDEKNLIKVLNADPNPKLNDIRLSGISFTFNYANVVNSWSGDSQLHYVPLMACKRPLNYRDAVGEGNINASVMTTSGVSMTDLSVSYNFEKLMDEIFKQRNVTFNHSEGVKKLLYNLYIMPNTKIGNTADETHIFTMGVPATGFTGSHTTRFVLSGSTDITDGSVNGVYPDNEDTVSWDTSTIGSDFYSAQTTGYYTINLKLNKIKNIPIGGVDFYVMLRDYGNYAALAFRYCNFPDTISFENVYITKGRRFCIEFYVEDVDTWYTYPIDPGTISAEVRIAQTLTSGYEYSKNSITFPDMLCSDYFINWCKTFNIFFIYDNNTRIVKTYMKYELPYSSYDLNEYLLLDKSYTFNSDIKAKNVDYKFKEGKDINNIAYKQATSKYYGQYTEVNNYDVGSDNLSYTSPFTVFPRTILNYTNSDNIPIDETDIVLHSELSESYAALNTDFLLFYKADIITGLTRTYKLQNGLASYATMNYCPDYGPTGLSGFSLNYLSLGTGKDNVNSKYETTLDFILPFDVLYNLKVYDKIFVDDIWWEISQINSNMRNGYTKLKLISIPVIPTSTFVIPSGTTTTTTTTVAPITTTTTTIAPTTTTTTTVLVQNTHRYNFKIENNSSASIYYQWTIVDDFETLYINGQLSIDSSDEVIPPELNNTDKKYFSLIQLDIYSATTFGITNELINCYGGTNFIEPDTFMILSQGQSSVNGTLDLTNDYNNWEIVFHAYVSDI